MRYIKLKPIKPSWAIGNSYRKELSKLTNAMVKEVLQQVIDEYKKQEPKLVLTDSNPIDQLYNRISVVIKKWQLRYNKYAEPIAESFITAVNKHVNYQLSTILEDVPTIFQVKMSTESRRALYARESLIKDNVNLITNIPDKMAEQIHREVMEASSRGRDIKYLEGKLKEIGIKTDKRCRLIARDQINKATSAIESQRQLDIGITQAIWRHSKAGKEPRQSHVRADGKIYDVTKGCLIDGAYIYPGELINCRCYCVSIIPLD